VTSESGVAVVVDDAPGSLARICNVLHRYSANILNLEIRRGRDGVAAVAIWFSCQERDRDLIRARLHALPVVHGAKALATKPTGSHCLGRQR